MGLLDPSKPFQFKRPDPTQYVGFDGVVFPMSRQRPSPACESHMTGGGTAQVYGTKYTIASCRILNQYGSRIILDIQHNGGKDASDPSEASATTTMAKELCEATKGGMKG